MVKRRDGEPLGDGGAIREDWGRGQGWRCQAMGLSEREQQALDSIEDGLAGSDPNWRPC